MVVILHINKVCIMSPQNTNKFRRKSMFNIYNLVLVSETSPFILNTRKFYGKGLKVLITITVVQLSLYDFSHHNDEWTHFLWFYQLLSA